MVGGDLGRKYPYKTIIKVGSDMSDRIGVVTVAQISYEKAHDS